MTSLFISTGIILLSRSHSLTLLVTALPLVEADCSINKDDALFSRYLHTRQRGIASKTYKVVSLNSCLEVCAGNPTCAGVNYNRHIGQCDVFDAIDGDADVNDYIDFYKNLCVIKEIDNGVSAAANVPPLTHRVSGTVTNKDSRSELLATKKVRIETRYQFPSCTCYYISNFQVCFGSFEISSQIEFGRESIFATFLLLSCPTPAVAQKLIPGPVEIQSSAVKVTRMQAFRFDSSSSIRVTCEIEICKGDCTPVSFFIFMFLNTLFKIFS
uniref:Apple domain-containing protein n=1 Tax=Heterorhabditis bacteriophora TaxID=37862 RepID=A0A1I7XH77_HETBA